MTRFNPAPSGDGSTESLVDLARCSRLHRILVAGSNSAQSVFELHRRGYNRVGTTATCGLPHGQYDVALLDWRGRTIKALETTLDWLVHFLGSSAVVAIRVDSQEHAANGKLAAMLEKLGFRIEIGTRCENGLAVSARRRDAPQMSVAA
jgi:hypothetical protein